MSTVLAPATPSVTPPPKAKATGVWKPTPAPAPHRLTISEYRKLGETGIYSGLKTMLLDGEIFIVPLPNPPHDVCLGTSDDLLRQIFQTGFHIRCQMGFDVGTRNDPGPDLAVVKGNRTDYRNSTPTSAVLVVEVADSSLFLDTTTKAELYATAQVPEYWVIDLENRRVLVFRDPVPLPTGLGATAYRSHTTFDPNDSFSPLAAPHVTVRASDLLP